SKAPQFWLRASIFPLCYPQSCTDKPDIKTVQIRNLLFFLSLLTSVAAVGGCAMLPADGPAPVKMYLTPPDLRTIPYTVVHLTPDVLSVLENAAPRLTAFADQQKPTDLRFGIGDVIGVTLFEASSGGLFIPLEAGVRPGNFVSFPHQAVK